MEEENGMYTLWSTFNIKIILNRNTLLRGSACCVYQVDTPPPPRVFKKPKPWKWHERCFYWQNCFLLCFVLWFFFCQASESVYRLLWNASQSIKSFDGIWFSAALMLCSRCYKNRHFVCRVPGEGKKKADNVLDANNGCQWHRGWHQTLFV